MAVEGFRQLGDRRMEAGSRAAKANGRKWEGLNKKVCVCVFAGARVGKLEVGRILKHINYNVDIFHFCDSDFLTS